MQIGFIGIGRMGRRMAGRILDGGFPLAVFDVNRAAAADLLQRGAVWAETPAALAARSEIVFTCLPGPAEMEVAVFGANGILEGIRASTIYIDHTTNSPMLVRRAAEKVREKGAEMLDMPVSGGVGGAEAGTLTMLAGGPVAALDRARPVLQTMGSTIIHTGDTGSASVCKVVHNAAVFCANLATVECLTLGVKAGVDPKVLVDVFLKSGIGRNLDLNVSLPATLFKGNFEPRFDMRTAHKDMRLATDMAAHYGVPVQVTEACEREMSEAMARGWGDRDNNIFLTLQEERAGVKVRC